MTAAIDHAGEHDSDFMRVSGTLFNNRDSPPVTAWITTTRIIFRVATLDQQGQTTVGCRTGHGADGVGRTGPGSPRR